MSKGRKKKLLTNYQLNRIGYNEAYKAIQYLVYGVLSPKTNR